MADRTPSATVINNEAASRYEIQVDGRTVGLADYVVGPAAADGRQIVLMPHTETSPEYGGRGLAAQLVRFALDDISAAGRLVEPACSFVAAFIRRNPEYERLLA